MFLSDPPASDLAETLYDEDRESDGYVSNRTRLSCWRPDVLNAFFGVRSALASGSSLSPADVAVLFAATAAARSDSYRAVALADWGRRVASDPNGTTPADISRLHAAGLTDQQFSGATLIIAWRMAFTAVNGALGARPDAQLAEAAPAEVRAEVRAAVRYGRAPAESPSA